MDLFLVSKTNLRGGWLSHSEEWKTLDLRVVSLSPTLGIEFALKTKNKKKKTWLDFIFFFFLTISYLQYCLLVLEFQPGVPWKGIQNIDPESDPYVTPGSVLGGTATSPIVDTDHQLLRDNTTGKWMRHPLCLFNTPRFCICQSVASFVLANNLII